MSYKDQPGTYEYNQVEYPESAGVEVKPKAELIYPILRAKTLPMRRSNDYNFVEWSASVSWSLELHGKVIAAFATVDKAVDYVIRELPGAHSLPVVW